MNITFSRKLTSAGLTGTVGSLIIMLSTIPIWTKNIDKLMVGSLEAPQNETSLKTSGSTCGPNGIE